MFGCGRMALALAGGHPILPGFGTGLLRHIEHHLVLIAHVDRSQMRILLPPLGQVLLVTAITCQKVGIAKVHLDVGTLGRQECPNVFRVGDIDFTELRRDFCSPGIEIGDELLVQVHTGGANRQRIPGGNSRDYGKGVVFCGHGRRRQVQQNPVGVHQAYGVAVAYEGHWGAFDDGDPQAAIDRLKPLTESGNPWRASALEMTAVARLKLGDKTGAVELFKQLADDLAAPEGVRARAAEMAAVLKP